VRRAAGLFRVFRRAWFIILLLALATPVLLTGLRHAGAQSRTAISRGTVSRSAPAPTQASDVPAQPTATRISPVSVTTINFKQLAEREAAAARTPGAKRAPTTMRAIHPPLTINDSPAGTPIAPGGDEVTAPAPPVQNDAGGPNVASPSPSQSFLAQEDGPKIGTTSFTIPPDTNGAVGLDKVFTNTNSNFRIHDKATGAALSTVNSDTFWAAAGGTGVFDPQIQYDPYNNRWILAITSNAQTASSSIEVAVSQTSDPQGSYFLFRFIVGCAAGSAGCNAGGEWADFPMLGFNKNWVAVSVNMFTISTNTNVNFDTLVLDYPTLRSGSSVGTLFRGAGIGFCNHPVTTFSPTENTLYFANHLSSGGATYRVSTITGTPAAPTFTIGATKTRPGGGWTQPGGDILPQQCIPGVGLPTQTCPATIRKIDSGDAQVRSNPVFRNGQIYYAQTIGLPAGGLTRTAAQWTALDATTGNFVDGGRIDDPTATATNGGKWYAYPSISVNKNGDVLLGFSEFESDDYADAGYTFRLGTDAAGTMRDPVIYKDGEDYYSKTFSGPSNRWGDYSHTLIDPVNDRDLWTIQEYAQLRTGTTGEGTNDSRWSTFWAKVVAPAGAGDLNISEFRLRGPSGANDEYIEIYNNNSSPLTVTTTDGSAGYAVAASDGVTRCTIPSGTVIPGRGHYLCVNSVAYSLASYPAGNGTTATGDATYTTDIPDNVGIALFNTATVANFSTTTRLDAVGSTSEANTLYKEGTGYPALTPFSIDYSFYRDMCGKGGSITQLGGCPTLGLPKDTNSNAADFVFVDTNGTSAGAGQRLGAPGPENLSSPIQRNNVFAAPNLDATVSSASPPNRVRDFTSDPANNSTFGTLDIRKRIVNNTGAPVTRLRFRIIDQTTFPAPSGFADLRARTSTAVVVSGINDTATCPGGIAPCTVTVQGTTLEQPPSQPSGGAFNSSLSAGTVTLATPIAPGASINVRFLLGIQQTGTFKFFINVEALP
jgi:hypothetical protein